MVTKRRRSRLDPVLQLALADAFIGGVPARMAAELVGVNRRTAILFYHKLREVIAARLAQDAPDFAGEIEADESYFGGVRKGRRGRGAGGKVPVFGLLKRAGKVHAVMIADARSATLAGIIRDCVRPESVVYTDSFASYNVLDVSEFLHKRVNHTENFVANGAHINGIENFWNQAKRHLRRYNGIPRTHFHLFLKECEWRFNYRPASRLRATLLDWAQITPPKARTHR